MDMDDYNYELHAMLQEAVDDGLIEESSAAHGVALQCIDDGYASLTPKQRAVYDLHVQPHLAKLDQEREVEQRIQGMPD